MEEKPKIKRLILEVPQEFHDKIKYEAMIHTMTIRKYVIRALVEKIKRDQK